MAGTAKRVQRTLLERVDLLPRYTEGLREAVYDDGGRRRHRYRVEPPRCDRAARRGAVSFHEREP
jgi:hypothetical protein